MAADAKERNKMNKKLLYLVTSAVIAALYAALTVVFSFMSYGMVQVRISEILTVLPYFTPAAVPGLFVGCVLANIISPTGPIDMIVGGAATLLAAFLSRRMPKKWLVPLPPVVCNAVFVGVELHIVSNTPLIPSVLWVALGEAIACYAGGIPLLLALERHKDRIFRR